MCVRSGSSRAWLGWGWLALRPGPLRGGVVLPPSKGSGVQARPSPGSQLESEEGRKGALVSAGLRGLKGGNVAAVWLITNAQGAALPLSMSEWARGVVWRWGWNFDWVEMFTGVWGERWHGFHRMSINAHCPEGSVWQAGMFGLGLLC